MVKTLRTLILWLASGLALGQGAVDVVGEPPVVREVSEVMVMDLAGRTLVGHGVAAEGSLHLRLEWGLGSFVVILVDVDGSVDSLEGREGRSGQLWVRHVGGLPRAGRA